LMLVAVVETAGKILRKTGRQVNPLPARCAMDYRIATNAARRCPATLVARARLVPPRKGEGAGQFFRFALFFSLGLQMLVDERERF
jgi:hypothetical protein